MTFSSKNDVNDCVGPSHASNKRIIFLLVSFYSFFISIFQRSPILPQVLLKPGYISLLAIDIRHIGDEEEL